MQGPMCCKIYILKRQGLSRFQGCAGRKLAVAWGLVYYVVGEEEEEEIKKDV